VTVGSGASAASLGGSATSPQAAMLTSSASPRASGGEATDRDIQWAGFIAALETLNS
jgi:hypothetical protein